MAMNPGMEVRFLTYICNKCRRERWKERLVEVKLGTKGEAV